MAVTLSYLSLVTAYYNGESWLTPKAQHVAEFCFSDMFCIEALWTSNNPRHSSWEPVNLG